MLRERGGRAWGRGAWGDGAWKTGRDTLRSRISLSLASISFIEGSSEASSGG